MNHSQFHSQDKDVTEYYHVTLESGRDFIMSSTKDVEDAAWDAYEEAALMDDYLVDVQPLGTYYD
tara:strand:+ start:342 stop:536 length:195 start_codon:yes stop_codon:yes gene_type:complete